MGPIGGCVERLHNPNIVGQQLGLPDGLAFRFLIVPVVPLDLDESGLDPDARHPHEVADPATPGFHNDLSRCAPKASRPVPAGLRLTRSPIQLR